MKLQIKEAIIVEGRYDIQTLKQCVDTVILQTGGFRIFKDKERLKMIRKIAEKRGILILTDSDGAGLTIRNFLRGAVPVEQVKHAYIPEILGKETRKRHASKAGTLGVEGMQQDVLKNALICAGATIIGEENTTKTSCMPLVKADLYALGLSGQSESDKMRKEVLKKLGLPQYLSANALLDFLNAVSDRSEIIKIIEQITQKK